MLNRVTFAMDLATAIVVSTTGVYVLMAMSGVFPAPVQWLLGMAAIGWALGRFATLMRRGARRREPLMR